MFTLSAWEPDTRHGADRALKKVNVLGMAVGAANAAQLGSMRDVGIDDLIRKVGNNARA
jgi:uncharacterized membrane protein